MRVCVVDVVMFCDDFGEGVLECFVIDFGGSGSFVGFFVFVFGGFCVFGFDL